MRQILIKFINNLVIRETIQGNTWDWIIPNISPQLTSRWNEHRTRVRSFLAKYKVKGKLKVCPLSSNEFAEVIPNRIPGYATAFEHTMLNSSHEMTLNAKISEAAWTVSDTRQLNVNRYIKLKQSHYRSGVVQRVPGVKVPRFHDNSTGWW